MEEVSLGWDLTKSACRAGALGSRGGVSRGAEMARPSDHGLARADWGHPEKGTTSVKSEADPKPLMAAGSLLAPLLCWAVSLFWEICVTTAHPLCPQVPSLARGGLLQGYPSLSSWGRLRRGREGGGRGPAAAAGLGAPPLSSLQPSSAVTSADLGGLPGVGAMSSFRRSEPLVTGPSRAGVLLCPFTVRVTTAPGASSESSPPVLATCAGRALQPTL